MNWLWSGSLTTLGLLLLQTSNFGAILKMALHGFSCVKDGMHVGNCNYSQIYHGLNVESDRPIQIMEVALYSFYVFYSTGTSLL